MNPRVTAVTPLIGHALLLKLNNGEQRRMDVSPYLGYPVYLSGYESRDSSRWRRPTTAP